MVESWTFNVFSALALSEWSDFESYGTQKLNDLEGLTSNCCLPWNVQKYSEEVELNMLRIFICSSTNRNKTESRQLFGIFFILRKYFF